MFAKIIVLTCVLLWAGAATGQRSILHAKYDLEYRLGEYERRRVELQNIIGSSLITAKPLHIEGVSFSNLIIPEHALILDSHIAQPTVRSIIGKTQQYVSQKMAELSVVRGRYGKLLDQVTAKNQSFIYKSPQSSAVPQVIQGRRQFNNFQFARAIDALGVKLHTINRTNVNQIMQQTYLEQPKLELYDSKKRLYFEGRKTMWRAEFKAALHSGCCDRLRPLHTSRMMIRGIDQAVAGPIAFVQNASFDSGVVVTSLQAERLYNVADENAVLFDAAMIIGPQPQIVTRNQITLNDLIDLASPWQPEPQKRLIFNGQLTIDELLLRNVAPPLAPRIGVATKPDVGLDLAPDTYLRKFFAHPNTARVQHIQSRVVVLGESHIIGDVDALVVNNVENFNNFVVDAVVRIDKPAVIEGRVVLNALSAPPPPSTSIQMRSVPVAQVEGELFVGQVNGMDPNIDVVFIDKLQPNVAIEVRGERVFANTMRFSNHLQVKQRVCGMLMPSEIIPLHLNDFIDSTGASNLWFVDGITTDQLTIQSGQFDRMVLRDVHGDAQSLVMRSVLAQQADGSQLVRAPLRVQHLKLLPSSTSGISNSGPSGLLNGFRPEDVIELTQSTRLGGDATHFILGRKMFANLVEARECTFGEINGLARWPSSLIRIDLPNMIQNVHTKLVFESLPGAPASLLSVNHLDAEFLPNLSPANYAHNMRLSPELYLAQQALARGVANRTGEIRYRVLNQLTVQNGLVNGVRIDDIVTLNEPFAFAERFVLIGKVDAECVVRAQHVASAYPLGPMDLVQFERYRVPTMGARAPIHLQSVVLDGDNQASFVQCRLLNGTPLSQFLNSIMSLTRPQSVHASVSFAAPTSFEGIVRTRSLFNNIANFNAFTERLRNVKYSFENGLQCNSLLVRES